MNSPSPTPLTGCEVLSPMLTAEETAREQGQDRQPKPKGRQRGGQVGKRFAMYNTFVDYTLATIPRTDALVWLVLFRDAHGGTAKSAQAYIARRAGLGKRTVGMAVKRLERAGLLDVLHRGGLNRGLSIYRSRPLAEDRHGRKVSAPRQAQTATLVGAKYLRSTQ